MQQGVQQRQRGLFVTGTDTGVGKTWLGQQIIQSCRASGVAVVPRKPVESGWQGDLTKTDAGLLARAAGCDDDIFSVCPNRLQAAVSPARAADMEGRRLTLDGVVEQCCFGVCRTEFLYVEGAGGFFSPLVNDGLNADLASALGLPVLLVAEDRLGCINHVLLTLLAIRQYHLAMVAVVVNTPHNALELQNKMQNAGELRRLVDVPVFSMYYQQAALPEGLLPLLLGDEKECQEVVCDL